MLVRTFLTKLTLRLSVGHSFSQISKHPLLDSQFFMSGPRSIHSSKPISKLFNTTFSQIQNLQSLLQQKGQKLLKKFRQEQLTKELSRPSQQNSEVKQYLQIYRNLMETIQKSSIENEQTYNIIGWYNMTPLKRTLVEKLLNGSAEELPQLIECLSWMNSSQGSIQEFFQSKEDYLEKTKKFYRRLPFSLTIDQLKKIDSIFKPASYLDQRKFYEVYLRVNLENILRDLHNGNNQRFVEDIIWLLHTSVKAMNDNEMHISKIEKFLLTWLPQIKTPSLEKLMDVYCDLGKANPLIYEHYIKPYLMKQKTKNGGLATLKFLIYSQTEDKQLMRGAWDQVNSLFTQNELSQAQISQLHTYAHYLQITKEKPNISASLQKKMQLNCSQQHCTPFITSLVLRNKSNKATISKMKKNNNKYISQCLQHKTERTINKLEELERDQFKSEYSYHLPGTNFGEIDIYKNPTFCNFPLEYLFYNRKNHELTNIQTQCESYTFISGQLKSSVVLRDQLLEHYGIKVKHMNTQKFQIKERKLSEEEAIMIPKFGSNKKKTKI